MYKNVQHYRHTVHRYLDGIWLMSCTKGKARNTMYSWLSVQMGLPKKDTHVSKFTRNQCKKAIQILRPRYIQIYGKDLDYNKRKENDEMSELKTISRTEYFEAAHLLPEHKAGCRNLHGHSYRLEVFVTGPATEPYGMVMDFSDLKEAIKNVMPDHMYLHYKGNPISDDIVKVLDKYGLAYRTFDKPTSAENMAPVLQQALQDYIQNELGYKNVIVSKILLNETVNSKCIYERRIIKMAYKQFNSEQEHIEFLLPILGRYRLFLQGYYNVTKYEILQGLSIVLNKPVEQCHFDKLNYEEICKVFDLFKQENVKIMGKRTLPVKGNTKKYGELLRSNKYIGKEE